MKRLMLMMLMVCASVLTYAQTNVKADAVVKFKELRHNFGKIKQGVPVTHDFEFTNVSGQPVIIETATASCGCTTPTWPQAPVMKEKVAIIKAGFNAAAPGPFEKTVYVKVKGIDAPLELRIAGEVISAADFDKLNKK
ncbi:MAG: DUF1573 domain-containing protein [Chitinophagaceae bacterium]|jgi:hypothetical protein